MSSQKLKDEKENLVPDHEYKLSKIDKDLKNLDEPLADIDYKLFYLAIDRLSNFVQGVFLLYSLHILKKFGLVTEEEAKDLIQDIAYLFTRK